MDEGDVEITKYAPSLLADITILTERLLSGESKWSAKLMDILDPFQEMPQLLDPILPKLVGQLSECFLGSNLDVHTVFYSLCKIRGAKTVSQLLPSDITCLEDVIIELENGPSSWQKRYGLLLWLSILVLAPFELTTFGPDTCQRIYSISLKSLGVPGKERDAATVVMGKLVTRSDARDALTKFLDGDLQTADIFQKIGVLQASAVVWRSVTFNISKFSKFYHLLLQPHDNALYEKFRVKNLGRVCLSLLSQQQFHSAEEIIGELLVSLSHKDTLVRYSASKAVPRIVHKLSLDFRLEVIEAVLATFSRNLLQEKTGKTNVDQVSASAWHGSLLCVAELLRRQLYPSELLVRLAEILKISLSFEQRRLTYMSGSNVRDASCYVCWSLFRANKSIDADVLDTIFAELVYLGCYDPEVNIRRAAAAALQEGIGRQGSLPGKENGVALGIALIQTVDYFKVGLRTRAYLELPMVVYGLGFHSVVDYAIDRMVCNWDLTVRRLCGDSLARFEDKPRIVDRLLGMYNKDNVEVRHGVIYALGEVLFDADTLYRPGSLVKILFDFSSSDLTKENEMLNCEVFLHLYRCLLKHYDHLEPSIKDDVLRLVDRLTLTLEQSDSRVVDNIRQSISLLPDVLPASTVDHWIDRMSCGQSTFAMALGLLRSSSEICDALVDVLERRVQVHDVRTRAVAVVALCKGIIGGNGENRYFEVILRCLDDYTIDSRGDVGSWVRDAAIESWVDVFHLTSDEFNKSAMLKLVRMSGEVLHKLRVKAVWALKKVADGHIRQVVDSLGEDEQVAKSFFSHMMAMLDVYGEHVMAFLTGLVTSAGAQQAGEDTLRGSMDAFLQYLRKLPLGLQTQLLEKLTTLVDIKVYGWRIAVCALRVWANIFQSGLDIPSGYNLRRLYVRVFNCHINTKALTRIVPAIQIFSGLAELDNKDALIRLAVLCKHAFPNIRVQAAEALYGVLTTMEDSYEVVAVLEETDWAQKGNESEANRVLEMVTKIAKINGLHG
jgi:hypothetical protein